MIGLFKQNGIKPITLPEYAEKKKTVQASGGSDTSILLTGMQSMFATQMQMVRDQQPSVWRLRS